MGWVGLEFDPLLGLASAIGRARTDLFRVGAVVRNTDVKSLGRRNLEAVAVHSRGAQLQPQDPRRMRSASSWIRFAGITFLAWIRSNSRAAVTSPIFVAG